MKHKNGFVVSIFIFGAIICVTMTVMGVLLFIRHSERRDYKNNYLAPFSNVYDVICEKYPFIISLRQDIGDDDTYCMYYIECNIAENIDCFDELVDVQREINATIEHQKKMNGLKALKDTLR